jgi:signal transduction histidine kinase/ActR/RegA family two-component response regulator
MLLVGATILPFALFSVLAFTAMLHQQKLQLEQATMGMARALATAIDARNQQTIAALEAFSLAQSLDEAEGDSLPAAHAAARLIRSSRPEWRGIVLAKPDGSVVFGSESPLGTGLRHVVEGTSVAEVVRTQAAVIGPMATVPRGNIGYTVRIPVVRLGKVVYVLTAIVSTDSILDVVRRQQVPNDWLVSVYDSEMKRVARSRDHRRYFGTAPSPTVQALLRSLEGAKETMGTTFTMEGEETYTAVSRIEGTDWTVVLGASRQTAEGALWRTASLYSAGLLLSLAIGGLAFFWVSRSITRRAKALADSAAALGRGEPLPTPHRGLQEFDAVSSALREAGKSRTRHEQEREALLRAETEARAAAERVQRRLELLLAATSSLSNALDEPSTLNAVALAVVPEMADILRIDLLKADGTLERKLTYHRDPRRVEAIEQVVHSGSVGPATPGSLGWVIASGREYVHHFDDAGTSAIEDPVFRRFVQVTGMRAVCAIPLIARGRTIGAMGAIQSSSDRRFGADEVALLREVGKRAALALDNVRLYADCTSALEKANAASKTKDEFLAMLGHELRNPLAPILTALEIVKRRDATAFVRERQIMERQAAHLARLVDDLLDISRIMAGKIQLQREEVDLRDVVLRALEITQPLFDKRLAPQVQGADSPVLVRGDLHRLAQVVGNLLSNAAKFSPPDEPITVRIEHRGNDAVFVVEDRGVGIPEEIRPHVFASFVQGAQSMQRAKGGLGLGLSIARSIVELHGGTIGAQNGSSGCGTQVTVTLPMFVATREAGGPPLLESGARRPARVLVVDDNADAGQMLASLLSLAGHEVGTALTAEECLDVVGGVGPDVCILDIGLPGMNGYELARRLRADPATRSLYLIALTGYGQYADREAALSAGFDDHMTKPADLERLESMLARARPKVRSGA